MFSKSRKREGHADLESLEMHIRDAMHSVGALMLKKLLNSDGGDYRGRTISDDNGHLFEFIEYRDKTVVTVLADVEVKRAYYYDRKGKRGICPKDKCLDIEGVSFSPGVRRIVGRAGAYRSFGLGHEDIKEMAGITVTAKEVERISHKLGEEAESFFREEADIALSDRVISIKAVPVNKMYVCMDGTGVPVEKKETRGRKGKGEDGQAKTREVKLGCVFTQTKTDEKGHPVRDEESTSYAGAIETAEEFSQRIYGEAKRRGVDRANEVCVIGDGAPWIWNIADEQFHYATQIVDLYHAREHYWNPARVVFGGDEARINQWCKLRRDELDEGRVEDVIAAIKELAGYSEKAKEVCEREIGYFEKNKERMRYGEFRRRGLFVGSGVLEAGCKSVVGQRLKQSGMHWTVKGANNIIALRCCLFSNRWEDFWEFRAAA